MQLGLGGKRVLITGGSKGIGLASARLFLDEGAEVALVSRDQKNIDRAVQELGGKAHGIAADLRDAAAAGNAVERAEAAMGPIDVLVNSAGAAQQAPPNELTPEV